MWLLGPACWAMHVAAGHLDIWTWVGPSCLQAAAAAGGRRHAACEMKMLVPVLLSLHICYSQGGGTESQKVVKAVENAGGQVPAQLPDVIDELHQTSQLTQALPTLPKKEGSERERLQWQRDRARNEARRRNDAAVRELLADGPLSLQQMWEVLSSGPAWQPMRSMMHAG
jgi:hypothetical protein